MIDPKKLPVYQHKKDILRAVRRNRVVVVESPTGSGKTTQIPSILYDAGYGERSVIGVTQPRRIAAVSVSNFIARQYGTVIPGLVGYKMRFVNETNDDTRIAIMTDGILLQELKTNPLLEGYSIIMVDEAHERSLNIDFILGLLKNILRERDDFKVIVSSATINAAIFSEYFDECPVVTIDAPMYPVEIRYDPPEYLHDYLSVLEKIVDIVEEVQREGKPGDVLIFLSGEGQIKDCITALSGLNSDRSMELLPLYGRLSREEQERVFDEFPGKRKVVVATNIAETSVTIDGIRHVVDPGFAKLNFYNQKNFTSSLVEVPISRASCNQRRGRAGRTAPGVCYRLYTEEGYNDRELFTREEIYRRDLSEVVLRMAELGIFEFEQFDFISDPGIENIRGAVQVLELLEAVDENRRLTPIGNLMVKFPIIPRLSRMIVAAIMEYPDVLQEVLIASAFLNGRAPFLLPQGFELEARKAHHSFRHKMGDFVSYLNIYRAYLKARDREAFCDRNYLDLKGMNEIHNVTQQLGEIVYDLGIPLSGGGDLMHYLCAVSKGLIQFVCKRSGKSVYSSLTAYGIKIHPGSVMFRQRPEYIVAGEIMRTSQMYAMSVSPLQPHWLQSISRELYESFVVRKKPVREKREAGRNYTNFIKIGRESFEIKKKKKGKKVVVLPFNKLSHAAETYDPAMLANYRNLRGTVALRGYELMSGASIKRILEVAPKIVQNGRIVEKWPRSTRFGYPRDSSRIIEHIPDLISPCVKAKSKNKLGFLTLLNDGEGSYWFSAYRDFIQALEESISSLEEMIDEDVTMIDGKQEKILNRTYRRLTALLEE